MTCSRWCMLPVAAFLLATGCVKIDSTLDVAADGSGTWRVIYAMPAHMIRQVEMTKGMSADLDRAVRSDRPGAMDRTGDLPYLFSEAAIRARFKELENQGILLNKVLIRSHGGWQYVDLTLKFTRVEAFFRQPYFDMCGVVLSGAGTGSYKLAISLPEMGDVGELPNLDDPAVSERVAPFMNGLRVVSRIGVPGDIRNSNSASSDSRRATWEWDFDKDSQALNRLAQGKMVLVFSGDGVRLRDFSKAVMRE